MFFILPFRCYFFSCINMHLNYKLYYTFLLVLFFSPKLFECQIKADQQDDCCALLKDSCEPTLERAVAKARQVFYRLENVTLDIAVTGETGAGKSSFVNAIRGVQDTDEGAAPTDVNECTMKPTMYPHPTMPNVKIWDLPGIGGTKVDYKYQNYDFFIIVSATRFKQSGIMLAKEIMKNNRKFYFVRTKTDFDVANEKRKKVSEEATLQKIRKDCEDNLKTLGSPPVFLITSHDLKKFDFPELENTLKSDLPDHKRYALVLSLPVYSMESLDKKYNTLKNTIWAVAFTSGAISAVMPISTLFLVWNVPLVVDSLTKYYNAFGLDNKSLENMSQRVNKPIQAMLAMVRESELVMAIAEKSSLEEKVKARLGEGGVLEALFRLVPVVGSIAAATSSFDNTQCMLLQGLDELYSVAKRVIEMAEIE